MVTPSTIYVITFSKNVIFSSSPEIIVKPFLNKEKLIAPNFNKEYELVLSEQINNQNKINSLRENAHDYTFQENEYKYYDSFFGSSSFSGQEIVYKNNKVCWSMNYYGKVLQDYFNGDFLKEVLLQVSEERPYRGAEIYSKGEFVYVSNVTGDITFFKGNETIYYRLQKIYEGWFHGGAIK